MGEKNLAERKNLRTGQQQVLELLHGIRRLDARHAETSRK
jgi:hypothetical protein